MHGTGSVRNISMHAELSGPCDLYPHTGKEKTAASICCRIIYTIHYVYRIVLRHYSLYNCRKFNTNSILILNIHNSHKSETPISSI
jgi:hypothetical protein